mgnify:CR=1 FL=1
MLQSVNMAQFLSVFTRGLKDPLCYLVFLFGVVAIFAPVLSTHSPVEPNMSEKLEAPSLRHFFGTDTYGMDIFSRTLYATRTDFSAAMLAVLLGASIGVPLGIVSGYVGGPIDDALNYMSEVIQSFPQILFAMGVLAVVGNNIVNLILVLAFFVIPGYQKIVRSIVLGLKNSEFVQAARCAGASPVTVIFRHLLPNAVIPLFGQFSIGCAYAIQTTAGLSFLGFGVKIPHPEWGSMITLGAPHIIFGHWWPAFFPGVAVFLAVLMLRQISERVRSNYANIQ